MIENETHLLLKSFRIVRMRRPSDSIQRTYYYWKQVIGIDVTNLFGLPIQENIYSVYSRSYGLKKSTYNTDNVEIIGTYKTGDIIKSRGSYIKIKYLELSDNFYVIGEDLGSGLKRRFILTMRPIKTYVLSDRIKKRLKAEKTAFLSRKESFDKDLKGMLKKRYSHQTVRNISSLGQYKAVRR